MAKRPYFIWDYDISEEQVWEILRGDNETRKVWLISRTLQYARWDDIWKYLTLDDVREYLDRIHCDFPLSRIYGRTRWKCGGRLADELLRDARPPT